MTGLSLHYSQHPNAFLPSYLLPPTLLTPILVLSLAHPQRSAGPVFWPESESSLTDKKDTAFHGPKSSPLHTLLIFVLWTNCGPHRIVLQPPGEQTSWNLASASSPAASASIQYWDIAASISSETWMVRLSASHHVRKLSQPLIPASSFFLHRCYLCHQSLPFPAYK